MKKSPKIRIYISTPLVIHQAYILPEKTTHYLQNVMKQQEGDSLICFDNQNGEFSGEIISLNKKVCQIKIHKKLRDFYLPPDIWLLFAPVKKDNTDFILQKATELGVRRIQPIITDRTVTEKVRLDRFESQAIEASEQCRRVDIPQITEAQKFSDIFQQWDFNRTLYFMDETGLSQDIYTIFKSAPPPCAILVGPEGGFSEKELQFLRQQPWAKGVSMGKRILRAETAVVASLSCWEALNGDWQNNGDKI